MKLNQIKDKMKHYKPTIMETYFESSVLIPLVEHQDELHVLFELRSPRLAQQPGEVCFPGGKREPEESTIDCALRETMEELGLEKQHIQIYGEFDTLHNYTNMTIYPFVGSITGEGMQLLHFGKDKIGRHIANPQEVEELFLVPLSFFMNTEPYVYKYPIKPIIGTDFPYHMIDTESKYGWREGRCTVPIFHYDSHVIWGITARILCNFVEKIRTGKI